MATTDTSHLLDTARPGHTAPAPDEHDLETALGRPVNAWPALWHQVLETWPRELPDTPTGT